MMCVALMGPNAANTTGGKVLIRSLHRAIRDMPEDELRSNLTDIRDRLSAALDTQTSPVTNPAWNEGSIVTGVPSIVWDDGSHDVATFAEGI